MAVSPFRAGGGIAGRFLGRTVSESAAFAAGVAIGPILTPPLQALRNKVNADYPFVPLSAQQATEAQVAGAFSTAEMRKEAGHTGINAERVDALRAFAGNTPALARMLELWNRGVITEAELNAGLKAALIRPEWHAKVKALRFEVPSGDVIAQMVVEGVLEHAAGKQLAADAGTDGATFDRLVKLHGQPIPPAEALELLNRGELSDGELNAILEQARMKPEWREPFKRLRFQLAPVSDLVRMAVREVFDPGQRAALELDREFPPAFGAHAARLGLEEQTAKDYWAAHWELPSYTQGVEMLHRGELNDAEFTELLKALDYAPRWRRPLEVIARRIPPISDMIRFAVREVYSPAQRETLGLNADYPADFTPEAALHGMDEERAKQYWAAHWRLPSAQQGYRMLWRDELEPAELDGLLKALDYPAKWRTRLANIAYLVPGRIDTRRMYRAGMLTRDQAIKNYERLGYKNADAIKLVELAGAASSTAAKEASATDELTLAAGGRIERATLITRLRELGYAEEDAERKADVPPARLVAAAGTGAIAGLHRNYVKGYLLDEPARVALLALEVPEWAADGILARWKIERDAIPVTPPATPPVTPPA